MNNRAVFVILPQLCPSSLHSGIQDTLPRLTAMIRGIGDPLVAAYARAYLCRVRQWTFSLCSIFGIFILFILVLFFLKSVVSSTHIPP